MDWVPGKSGYWRIPRGRFNGLALRLGYKFGAVYIIQPHSEQEKCAPSCWLAEGLECECSCMGEHHGEKSAKGRWYVISETCAVRWKDAELRWSLLRPKGPVGPAPLVRAT